VTQDEVMQAILTARLPNDGIENVSVILAWSATGDFLAEAFTKKKAVRLQGKGGSGKDALLELAAFLIFVYPIDDGEQIGVDIPLPILLKTKIFTDWFAVRENKKGD